MVEEPCGGQIHGQGKQDWGAAVWVCCFSPLKLWGFHLLKSLLIQVLRTLND